MDLANDSNLSYSIDLLPPPSKDIEAPKPNDEDFIDLNSNIINQFAIDILLGLL